MAERPDTRQLGLGDCELISRRLSEVLDSARGRRPRPGRGLLPPRGQLARHRSPADPIAGFRGLEGPSGAGHARRAVGRPQAIGRHDRRARRRRYRSPEGQGRQGLSDRLFFNLVGEAVAHRHRRPAAADRVRPDRRPVAKQVILQKVREAERERQYEEFKDRAGEIINGVVKRESNTATSSSTSAGRGILRRDEQIPREMPTATATASARYICDVRRERAGRRSSSPHSPGLHGQAVRPGSAGDLRRHHRDQGGRPRPGQPRQDRVISYDSSIDPVGACVGMRGSRVQAVVQRAAGREDRHHPLVGGPGDLPRQRAPAGRGQSRSSSTRKPADRGRRSRRPAVARHRPPRPERAPGEPAHRARHRHPDREQETRARSARPSSPSAPRAVHGRARRRRDAGAAAGRRRLHHLEEVAYVDLETTAWAKSRATRS
jgi:hypothetical protein